MLGATAVLTSMHASVRYVSAELHPFEITFFRNLFGLLWLAPLMVKAGRAGLVSRQPRWQLARSTFGIAVYIAFACALTLLSVYLLSETNRTDLRTN